MSDPDIGHNSGGGVTRATVLSADAELLRLQGEVNTATANLRNAKRRWKKEGVDVAVIATLQKERNQDEEARLAAEAIRRRYASWMRVSIEPKPEQLAIPEEDSKVSSEVDERHMEALADNAGFRAGRLGTNLQSSNIYAPGSASHAAFARGWHRGQAEIAAEMGPGVTMASDAREKPGRKKAGAEATTPEVGAP